MSFAEGIFANLPQFSALTGFSSFAHLALAAEAPMPDGLDLLMCPLTMEVKRDPVITADGQTYERTEIHKWFALGNRTSPLTGAELPSTNPTPNIGPRKFIQESGLLK